ncbi:hypothetical protein EHS25_008247 [Saitozyma podzolica]|uniref:Uncharacterized protein n=1 Tax=Saitozyma podzolica TaxID=1890683 RepID=A0A427YP06_9TREE|nr:hypothetical protein EHS25_008247 [Saitozyma podzolica]
MPRPRALLPLLLALALGLAAPALAAQTNCPADPYANPSKDTCNPLRYVPNKAANIVGAVLYFVVAIALTVQHFRFRANYFLCLVIGAYCEAIGLVLRIIFRNQLHSQGVYIAMYLFVVLSPCAFLAGDYILLGRIAGHLDGARYLRPLKPNLISWTFVISDVITFLIQAAGGGLSISKTISTAEAGGHIFLAGIAIQMASFLVFSVLWAIFAYRVRYQDQALWQRPGWKPLHWALGFTCICFLVRSFYRTVELSQGYIGYIATHEIYYLTLDALPLILGIATYVFFWPGQYLTPETRIEPSGQGAELGEGAGVGAGEHEMEIAQAGGLGARTPGTESVETKQS